MDLYSADKNISEMTIHTRNAKKI